MVPTWTCSENFSQVHVAGSITDGPCDKFGSSNMDWCHRLVGKFVAYVGFLLGLDSQIHLEWRGEGEFNVVYPAGVVSLKEQKREQTTYLGCGKRRSEGLRSEMLWQIITNIQSLGSTCRVLASQGIADRCSGMPVQHFIDSQLLPYNDPVAAAACRPPILPLFRITPEKEP